MWIIIYYSLARLKINFFVLLFLPKLSTWPVVSSLSLCIFSFLPRYHHEMFKQTERLSLISNWIALTPNSPAEWHKRHSIGMMKLIKFNSKIIIWSVPVRILHERSQCEASSWFLSCVCVFVSLPPLMLPQSVAFNAQTPARNFRKRKFECSLQNWGRHTERPNRIVFVRVGPSGCPWEKKCKSVYSSVRSNNISSLCCPKYSWSIVSSPPSVHPLSLRCYPRIDSTEILFSVLNKLFSRQSFGKVLHWPLVAAHRCRKRNKNDI